MYDAVRVAAGTAVAVSPGVAVLLAVAESRGVASAAVAEGVAGGELVGDADAVAVATGVGGVAVIVPVAVALAASAVGVSVRATVAAAVTVPVWVTVALAVGDGPPAVEEARAVAVAVALAVALAVGVAETPWPRTATTSAAEITPSPFASQIAGSPANTARIVSVTCPCPGSQRAQLSGTRRSNAAANTAATRIAPAVESPPSITGIMGRARDPMPADQTAYVSAPGKRRPAMPITGRGSTAAPSWCGRR